MTNYTKHAVKGTAIVFIISAFAAFLGYILRLVLARNLSLEDFGLFYAVFSFLGFLTIFQTLGFDRALVKFVAELSESKKNDLVKSSILYVAVVEAITNSIILVLVYLFSSYLSIHFFHSGKALIVLKLMVISFTIDNFVSILKYVFQGYQKMVLYSGVDLVRMIIIIIVALIGFRLNYGILSPVIGYIIAPLMLFFIFGGILLNKVFDKFIESRFVWNKDLFREISKYSFHIIATSIAVTIFTNTDTLLLTYFKGLSAVALFNIALPTARIFRYLPEAVGSILLPMTSELWTKKKKHLLKAGMESLYKYSIIITVPLVFVLLSFSDLIITILFGKEYVAAANAMRILSVGMIFMNIHLINNSFFLGVGNPQILSKIFYTSVVFNFVVDLFMIPAFGIIGAALTTSSSYFLMMVYGTKETRKFVHIHFPVSSWAKTIVSGLIFTGIIALLKIVLNMNVWVETAIILAIAGLCYAALLFIFKVVNVNELKDLYKRVVG